MDKFSRYMILSEASIHRLNSVIIEAMEKGWQPIGQVNSIKAPHGFDYTHAICKR